MNPPTNREGEVLSAEQALAIVQGATSGRTIVLYDSHEALRAKVADLEERLGLIK